MKKKISVVLLLIMIVTCGLTLIGCETQRKVEIVLYHPITGEEIEDLSRIEFKLGELAENTKIEIAIRDVKSGKLLTDEDLEPYSSLETCCRIAINLRRDGPDVSLWDSEHWPVKSGSYDIHIEFNCVDNTDYEYERRYVTTFQRYYIEIGE